MRKLFTLTLALFAGLSLMAETIYSTDCKQTPESPATASFEKGEFATTAESWAADYANYFKTTGSAGQLTLTFEPAISLAGIQDATVKVYWGSVSNRPLNLSVNGASAVEIDKVASSADRSQVREAVGELTGVESLSSIKLSSSGGGNVYIFRIVVESAGPACTAPAEALKLSASKSANILVGDQITFSVSGGNGAEITISGEQGESINNNTWTATAGKHVFTASQDAKDGICGGEDQLELTVISTDPVTAAVITGEHSVVLGGSLTLTCDAANADTYQWYLDGKAISGANASTYVFEASEKGNYVFACEASNQYTSTPVRAADFRVEVTGICGELIKATVNQEVTGVIGGTMDTNLKKGESAKLNKNTYFGITLTEGAFLEGDVFVMEITTAPDDAATMGTMKLYADKEGSELLFETDQVGVVGSNEWILPESVAGKKSLYIIRGGGADWNPTFSSVAVTRDCSDGPRLTVSPAVVTLAVTAQQPTATATVAFSGKNLTAGTYSLTVPNLAGMSVTPASVTVGNDGKLNATVEIAYTSTVDVEAGSAEVALTIGELNAKVAVAYSANISHQFGKSIDFEDFVIKNGINGNFAAELAAKNIETSADGFSLDSLNSEKADNNEPYLGLKIKAANAFVGCWLHKEDTISIKFGKVSANVMFYAADGSVQEKTPEELVEPFEFVAPQDMYVKLVTTTAAAVVVKQILINCDSTKDTDATIQSLSVNGVTVESVAGVYAYEVPANENLAEVEVVYTLSSLKATATPASGFKLAVPAAGEAANTQTITVTAENGDQKTYTVSVTRASSSAIVNTVETNGKAVKLIRNGQLLIIRDGKEFNILGTRTK